MNISHVELRKDGASLSGGTYSSTAETLDSNKSATFSQVDTINHTNSMEDDLESVNDETNNTGNELDERTEMLNNLNIDYDFNQEISDLFFYYF